MDILIATNNEDIYTQMSECVSNWGYRPIFGESVKATLSLMSSSNAPVIAIIDELLDHDHGLSIIRALRRKSEAPYQYLIILSSCIAQNELRALQLGADAYITKPISVLQLRVQLHVARRIMSKHIQARKIQEQLWHQANIDQLTGLPNRRAVFRSIEKNMMLCSQYEQPLGIMMIDLDHFKDINDGFGHDGGDIVLKEASRRMQNCIRTSDMIGRFGGEEFLAVIPNQTVAELRRIGERIRLSLASEPVVSDDFVIPVSCSIGIAVLLDYEEGSIDNVIQQADKALYVAKEMGRNRVVAAWTLYHKNKII